MVFIYNYKPEVLHRDVVGQKFCMDTPIKMKICDNLLNIFASSSGSPSYNGLLTSGSMQVLEHFHFLHI